MRRLDALAGRCGGDLLVVLVAALAAVEARVGENGRGADTPGPVATVVVVLVVLPLLARRRLPFAAPLALWLLAALLSVADGTLVVATSSVWLSPSITRRVISHYAGAPHRAPPPEVAELTERELAVFRLIAQGLSNAEIGRQLFIGEATVKTHVTHLLQKLDLRDRVQAVVLAYQCRLFDDEPSGSGGPTGPGRR